jgi:hypothetical protein
VDQLEVSEARHLSIAEQLDAREQHLAARLRRAELELAEVKEQLRAALAVREADLKKSVCRA